MEWSELLTLPTELLQDNRISKKQVQSFLSSEEKETVL